MNYSFKYIDLKISMKLFKQLAFLVLVVFVNPIFSQADKNLEDPQDIKFRNGVHVVAEVSNKNPKLGETITIIYKLYVSQDIGISSWQELKAPDYSLFESKDLSPEKTIIENGTYKSETYRFVVLRKVELKSKGEGIHNIEPLKLQVTADVPSKEKDVFGAIQLESITKTLSTEVLVINVKS